MNRPRPTTCYTDPMEAPMQYKTIVLELLQQIPELHDRLRRNRTLFSTLEQLAAGLKDSHEEWKRRLAQSNLHSSEQQTSSAALELGWRIWKPLCFPRHRRTGKTSHRSTE